VAKLSQEASKIAQKRARLLELWPNIFVEMVKDAVVEMWDMEAYVKRQQKLFDEAWFLSRDRSQETADGTFVGGNIPFTLPFIVQSLVISIGHRVDTDEWFCG